MAVLLGGLPVTVPGVTINRLCGSGMNAVGNIADGIRTGAIELGIAGGVESMSRAPFVMGKQATAFGRNAKLHDTTLGWRFVNRLIEEQYGVDSMADTAENVADGFLIARQDQDAFALRSQQRAEAAIEAGVFREEIVPVSIPGLAKLRPIVRAGGTVTAGNASGINDGACAMIVASEEAARRNQLEPLARVVGWAVAGVEPRIMGIGPAPATQKVLEQCGLTIEQMDLIELNEAFAAQALATLRQFGIPDDAGHVNPNGGAIALGHPLGMSGARLVTTATRQLQRTGGKFALCTMCVGVGQGIAMIIERV
jgi:acetyl-CoA acetyltransferase family protein